MNCVSFQDHFWGDKNQGFDVLYQNMKHGIKTSSEFLDYLRDIYAVEDSCSKSWTKLSKLLSVNTSGTLQPYWTALKEFSDKKSAVHSEMGQNIQILIKSVQKYIEEQQGKQKSTKDTDIQTQNFINLLTTTATQLTRAKEVYHSRYFELQKFLKSNSSGGNKLREVEKMESKLKKAVDEYKYLIEKYNNTCKKFKSKMIESCKNFQDIETFHLVNMRDFIQRLTMNLSKCLNDINKHRIELENTQDSLTFEFLLETFIKARSTGKIPPESVMFEDAENVDNEKQTKDFSEALSDSVLNGNCTSDAATGNLVNIDSSSDVSSTHVSNMNLASGYKDSINDIFEQLSNLSDNNSVNINAGLPSDTPSVLKKQKKYNNIFRRKRNSPVNGGNSKSNAEFEKDTSCQNVEDNMVDDEGYSIKPSDVWNETTQVNSSDSSSDDDHPENIFKGMKINIRPKEPNSNSSSIPDDLNNKEKDVEDVLLKAVQQIKLPQVTTRKLTDSRSETPALIENVSKGVIKDARKIRSNTIIEISPQTSLNPQFQVNFEKSLESEGLDLAQISDPFNSKFESLRTDDDAASCKFTTKLYDPWGLQSTDDHVSPPPLPAKITPPRAASALPYAQSKDYFKTDNTRTSLVSNSTMKVQHTPGRTALGNLDGIPLAVAFTETVNAKFRDPFSNTPNDVHTSGQLVVSFPSSMLQQFENIGEIQLKNLDPIIFHLKNANRLRNVEPFPSSADIILKIKNPADDSFDIYLDLFSLFIKLKSQRKDEPSVPYFNVDIVHYDVTNSVRTNGSINAPVCISANWQLPDTSTSHLLVSYTLQWPNLDVGSLTFKPVSDDPTHTIKPKGEIRFLVVADGSPQKMQSLPPCIWNSEIGRSSWRLDVGSIRGSIKAKYILSRGPGSPQPVVCQFSAEGSIESGVLIQVSGSRFRISRHKYRLISGRYVWEPPPISNNSTSSGFCV